MLYLIAACLSVNNKSKCSGFIIYSNSIPPTTSLVNFHEKLQAAAGQCFVDTAFWGGVVPGNQVLFDHLHTLLGQKKLPPGFS